MVRAFYCKELAGFTTTQPYKYLADAERACTLGFDPTSLLQTRPLQDELHLAVHGVMASLTGSNRSLQSPQNVPSRLPTTWATRSEYRYINEKAKNVIMHSVRLSSLRLILIALIMERSMPILRSSIFRATSD